MKKQIEQMGDDVRYVINRVSDNFFEVWDKITELSVFDAETRVKCADRIKYLLSTSNRHKFDLK